jgi:beta-glucanase (GH16 family)
VMEFVSQSPNTIYGTAHFAVGGAHQSSGGSTNLASPPADAFHVYAVEWTATKIDWFLDTTQYHTYDTTQAIDGTPFQAPFYLLLNYAIGGAWPEAPVSSEYPCKMLVDWVRVWQ